MRRFHQHHHHLLLHALSNASCVVRGSWKKRSLILSSSTFGDSSFKTIGSWSSGQRPDGPPQHGRQSPQRSSSSSRSPAHPRSSSARADKPSSSSSLSKASATTRTKSSPPIPRPRNTASTTASPFRVHVRGDWPYGSRQYLLLPTQVGDLSRETEPYQLASLWAHRNILFGARLAPQRPIDDEDDHRNGHDDSVGDDQKGDRSPSMALSSFSDLHRPPLLLKYGIPLVEAALRDAGSTGEQPQAMATLHGLCDWVAACMKRYRDPDDAPTTDPAPGCDRNLAAASFPVSHVLEQWPCQMLRSPLAAPDPSSGTASSGPIPTEPAPALTTAATTSTELPAISTKPRNPRRGKDLLDRPRVPGADPRVVWEAVQVLATGTDSGSAVSIATRRDAALLWEPLAREYVQRHEEHFPHHARRDESAPTPGPPGARDQHEGAGSLLLQSDECRLYQATGGQLVNIELEADTQLSYLQSAGGAMARFFFF